MQHNPQHCLAKVQHMLSELPFIALRIDADGTLGDFSLPALNLVGRHRIAYGARLERLFDPVSSTRIRMFLEIGKMTRRTTTSEQSRLGLINRAGSTYSLNMLLTLLPAEHGQPVRLYLCEDVGPGPLMSALLGNAEVLDGFIETTHEPMWGIEFDEPVNLDTHEDEIVRQVFSNECHWIFCNRAFKRLYSIPDELDMRVMPVSAQFPRNPQNENFVRQFVRNDFSIDSILTVDQKHDGTTAYVENNARGYAKSGRLYRIWGTVHDITEPHYRQEQLLQHSELMQRTLSALPVAVIIIDRIQRIRGVNTAAESLFGEPSTVLLGTELEKRFHFEDKELERSWYNGEIHEGHGILRTFTEKWVACTLKLAPVDGETSELFVIAILPTINS